MKIDLFLAHFKMNVYTSDLVLRTYENRLHHKSKMTENQTRFSLKTTLSKILDLKSYYLGWNQLEITVSILNEKFDLKGYKVENFFSYFASKMKSIFDLKI